MINQKRKKNKMKTFILITLVAIFSLPINADDTVCKKFDIKCKANKFVDIVLVEHKNLSQPKLKSEKYNLIRENKILEVIPKKK